jgi:hypothetical protein
MRRPFLPPIDLPVTALAADPPGSLWTGLPGQGEERPAEGAGFRSSAARFLPFRADHLYRMTDHIGIVQHAFYAVPDRKHGYSVDDQARALIACLAQAGCLGQSHAPVAAYTYLSYLHHAMNPDGSFHNFLSFDGRWLDDRGSEDAQGRVLWALGYAVRFGLDDGLIAAAGELFDQALPFTRTLRSLRSCSFALFGLYHRLRVAADDAMLNMAHDLARCLVVNLEATTTADWPWFEPYLTYCNAKLPAALLLASELTGEPRYRAAGLESLAWLMTVVFTDEGQLRLVGQDGWYPRGGRKAPFDEQCVDAQGTIEAALLAYRITHEPAWRDRAIAAFAWFTGENVRKASLIDSGNWGCYDGITATGLNRNMGAESIICYLLSYLDLVDAGLLGLDGQPVSVA